MKVLIDADACPVVDIAVNICRKHGIPCLLLCEIRMMFLVMLFAVGALV